MEKAGESVRVTVTHTSKAKKAETKNQEPRTVTGTEP
jgi:hypothetical protein